MSTQLKDAPDVVVGQRVKWREGKRPRFFSADVRGVVRTPLRAQSGDTVYVEWDGHGSMPCSVRAIERV